jgi:hypothetical protein
VPQGAEAPCRWRVQRQREEGAARHLPGLLGSVKLQQRKLNSCVTAGNTCLKPPATHQGRSDWLESDLSGTSAKFCSDPCACQLLCPCHGPCSSMLHSLGQHAHHYAHTP